MTLRTVINTAGLLAAVGYADGAGAQVPGTAVPGDIIELAAGVYDPSETTDTLWPAHGVRIRPAEGASPIIENARANVLGAGGTDTVTIIEGLHFRANGVASRVISGVGNWGVFVVRDASVLIRDVTIENNKAVASGNNFTAVTTTGVTPCRIIVQRLVSIDAGRDGVSSHGSANGSVIQFHACRAHGHGDEPSDQCLTPHQDVALSWFGGVLDASGTASGVAYAPGTGVAKALTPGTIKNAIIYGTVSAPSVIEGCVVHLTPEQRAVVAGGVAVELVTRPGVMRDCIVPEGIVSVESSQHDWDGGFVIERVEVGTEIDTVNGVVTLGSGNANRIPVSVTDLNVFGGNRGLDVRGAVPSPAPTLARVRVLAATGAQFGVLVDAADGAVVDDLVASAGGGGLSYTPADPTAAQLAVVRNAIRIGGAPAPVAQEQIDELLALGGWDHDAAGEGAGGDGGTIDQDTVDAIAAAVHAHPAAVAEREQIAAIHTRTEDIPIEGETRQVFEGDTEPREIRIGPIVE